MNHTHKTNWLERPVHPAFPAITSEIALFVVIVLLAIVTRFYDLDTRVMSHDESLHTYFSWLLYRGQGYQHTPMMHGPWQFHWIALSYFLFGVSDFTARIPAVLFSIATVWMVWYWRRYLGNWGALIAGLLMVVSPYMLYYGRYVRNESYAGLAGILLLYAILRYLDSGRTRYLWLVTLATVLHFTAKETAFIYTAQAIFFLVVYFIVKITKQPWRDNQQLFRTFVIALVAGSLLLGAGAAFAYVNRTTETISGTETVVPANPTEAPSAVGPTDHGSTLGTILLGLGALILLVAGVTYFVQAYLWHKIPKERSFDLLILMGTFVLPMATAFPIDWLKSLLNVAIPTDAASVNALDTRSMTVVGVFVAVLFLLSLAVGLLWNRDWWKYGAVFWGIFTIFYTTVFTNAAGFFTGIVGSLGYWLVQQGVERGSQPEYYYVLVQIPMYEFLPAIGTLLAVGLGLKKLLGRGAVTPETLPENTEPQVEEIIQAEPEAGADMFGTFFGLTVWWAFSSVLAFTVAGERMPWLTYHMAWPMILLTGWAIGQII
ncbi:MAG TPA: flippase activity-associated protein Agl23, partial [Anaerolineales bacterium]|nr:flippase activity-associated protein Agl23 [Anaerolineales bacterium]